MEKEEKWETHKIKLNYNSLVREIIEALASDDIEYVQNNAWHIEVGLQLLNGYLTEIAEHTIETEDPWLVEWCKNLLIIKEDDDEKAGDS